MSTMNTKCLSHLLSTISFFFFLEGGGGGGGLNLQ